MCFVFVPVKVFEAVDAGEDLAPAALVAMLLHLGLLHLLPARIAGEINHGI